MTSIRFLLPLSVILILMPALVSAQPVPRPSLEIYFDYLPYQSLTEPEAGTFLEDLEIRVNRLDIRADYPFTLTPRRTYLMAGVGYQLKTFDLRNWDEDVAGDAAFDEFHTVQVSLMLQHILNQKWSLWGFASPGIASDFEGAMEIEDFTFSVGLAFIRMFSPSFQMGFGAFYSSDFGHPLPLPAISLFWNNGGNMRAEFIVPVNLELWYSQSNKLEFGLLMKIEGNQFQGDPEKYGYEDPNLRYTDLLIGPAVNFDITPTVQLNLYGGYTFARAFDLYDEDEKITSYDLSNTVFLRAGLKFGG